MLKKTITYTDYSGKPRTETFWFHFNYAELAEMEYGVDGGLTGLIEKLSDVQEDPTIIGIFKDLVLKAYGERSADGKYFMKYDKEGNPLSRMFAQSAAYPVLFMELASDAKAAAEFFNGIIPKDEESAQDNLVSIN